ncbi:MAG: hypothetical protein OXG82_04365 [Gammaproteobacteria bacterium]|nr:hypothetical protein [Gammaproteobacteria bacterium]
MNVGKLAAALLLTLGNSALAQRLDVWQAQPLSRHSWRLGLSSEAGFELRFECRAEPSARGLGFTSPVLRWTFDADVRRDTGGRVWQRFTATESSMVLSAAQSLKHFEANRPYLSIVVSDEGDLWVYAPVPEKPGTHTIQLYTPTAGFGVAWDQFRAGCEGVERWDWPPRH